MTEAALAWVLLAVWLGGGAGGWWFLRRRGHAHPGWLLSALVLGPFAVVVFVERAERGPRVVGATGRPAGAGRTRGHEDGPVLLVGVDGSEESRAAARAALDVVRHRPCSVVLCAVVDHDRGDEDAPAVRDARAQLDVLAERLRGGGGDGGDGGDGRDGLTVVTEVRSGRAVEAISAAAADHDADLVVVGARGRGLSRAVLGSVAEGLVRCSPAPVLVAPPTCLPTRR